MTQLTLNVIRNVDKTLPITRSYLVIADDEIQNRLTDKDIPTEYKIENGLGILLWVNWNTIWTFDLERAKMPSSSFFRSME